MKAILGALSLVVGVVLLYTFYEREPERMNPTPYFSDLCKSSDAERGYASHADHYLSFTTANDVDLGWVWETQIRVPRGDQTDTELFQLQSSYFAEMTRPDGTVVKQPGFIVNLSDEMAEYRFRVRADAIGKWAYVLKASQANELQRGEFIVKDSGIDTPKQVVRDTKYPSKLLAGDTPFYWVGGKWVSAQNYVPCRIPQMDFLRGTHQPVSDEEYLSYLATLITHKHNSFLVKLAQFPLMSDGFSWDLEWIARGDWMIREALSRGLYVQINIFDTWSRNAEHKVLNNTKGENQVFNAWTPSANDLPKIKSYLNTIVARFSAYPNVVWELGNEMEHRPNCGECFVKAANEHYLPWLKSMDVYGHLIGLSESVWLNADVDMGFLHQTRTKDFENLPNDPRPMVMNELVFSDDTAALWKDATIRDGDARFAFRRTFWRNLALGTTGSFEATWLNIGEELSEEVMNVMADHAVLAEFVSSLDQDLNSRHSLPDPLFEFGENVLEYGFKVREKEYAYLMLMSDEGDPVDITTQLISGANGKRIRILNLQSGEWADVIRSDEILSTYVLNREFPDLLIERSSQ